jgi:excisionase family DNA binding protein
MNTRELAKYLGINEKKIYSLISEKGLPASRITGGWFSVISWTGGSSAIPTTIHPQWRQPRPTKTYS